MRKFKTIFLVFFFSLLGLKQVLAQDPNVEAYINKYKALAINEMIRTGVPAAISLAQGIVESSAGTSWLSRHANNQFGIKCKRSWKGKHVYHQDALGRACFRKYHSPAASWKDHSNFLKNNVRYSFLFKLNPLNYKGWARGLKKAGYATNNRYARILINTVKKYHLNQYSKKGLRLKRKGRYATISNRVEQTPVLQPQKTPQPESTIANTNTGDYPDHLFQINKRSVLYLPQGTQLIAIAEKYDIPLRRIVRYNGLKSGVLPGNMLVFIQKKRKKGSHKTHIVQPGETWHEIAQKEGIRLKWLLKRNYKTGNTPPKPGTVLTLKGYAGGRKGRAEHGQRGFFGWIFGG